MPQQEIVYLPATQEQIMAFIKSKLELINVCEDGSVIIRYNPIKK